MKKASRASVHPALLDVFFNDTATTEIYTLSLHDALPISLPIIEELHGLFGGPPNEGGHHIDRKSTRLNSSHLVISYAVLCLKKSEKEVLIRGCDRQRGPLHPDSQSNSGQ